MELVDLVVAAGAAFTGPSNALQTKASTMTKRVGFIFNASLSPST